MKRIKIVSNGTIEGTTVSDAETGELIEGVESVSFEADANECSVKAILRLHNPVVELVTDNIEVK